MKECLYIPELETERLILRKVTAEDAGDLQKWFGLEEVYTYWGRPAGKAEKNPELLFSDPRPWVKRKPSHDFIWGIVRKDTRQVIGLLEIFDVENDRMGKVGYRVAPSEWNRGVCTEALRRVIDFIFDETPLDRLETTADVRNTGSNRVLEKCGFRREGTVRHGKMGVRYCDYHLWGLLREDVPRQKAHIGIYDDPGEYLSQSFLDEADRLWDEAENLAENEAELRRIRKSRLSVRFAKARKTDPAVPGRAEDVEKLIGDIRAFGIGYIRESQKLEDSFDILRRNEGY